MSLATAKAKSTKKIVVDDNDKIKQIGNKNNSNMNQQTREKKRTEH